MNDKTWKSAHVDDIERGGNRWIAVRKHFDIGAFGVNAWEQKDKGGDVIGEHTEDSGHEELYVVTQGHATFTIDGDEVDAPAGTYVYVKPAATRKAVARDAATTILAIGAKPGEVFEAQAWEVNADMWPLYEAGDYAGAAAVLERALEKHPGHHMLLYNLACVEALGGRKDEAVEHVRQALAGAPEQFLEMARNDSDLDSIRDDERFPVK